MRRCFALVAVLLTTCSLLAAGEFDLLVREFSRESGAERIHIPFFGLARFVVAVGHPAGTSELNLAVFENASLAPRRFSEITDSIVSRHDWQPMIRVRSRHSESTNIYSQRNGKDLLLLIASLDENEATFVLVRIKPQELMKFIDEHEFH